MKNNQIDHTRKERLAGLELLRFISAFSVLVWHYQHFSIIGLNLVDFDRVSQSFYQILRIFYV
jgi:peptidoglycan/LPS O-acetylase OafA/YrhL